jgi:hypothetical protein
MVSWGLFLGLLKWFDAGGGQGGHRYTQAVITNYILPPKVHNHPHTCDCRASPRSVIFVGVLVVLTPQFSSLEGSCVANIMVLRDLFHRIWGVQV